MLTECKKLLSLAYEEGVVPPTETGELACAFVGEWNAGKTTLINALTGTTLPEGAVSTTKTVVRIRHADEMESTVFYPDGNVKQVQGDEAWTLVDQAAQEGVKRVEFGDPKADLPDDVVFVDTPGFNDQDAVANTMAEGVQADIIVFVLLAGGSTLNQVQKQFIDEVLLAKKGHNLLDIFFVFTHADMLESEEDRDATVDRFLQKFGYDMLEHRQFHFVTLLKGSPAQGVDSLKSTLYDHLRKRSRELLPERTSRLYRELKGRMRQRIAEQEALMERIHIEKSDRKTELREKLDVAYQKERSQREEIRERQKMRIDRFSDQLSGVLEPVSNELEAIVNGLSSEELKTTGILEKEITNRMEGRLQPQVRQWMEEIQQQMDKDLGEAESASQSLLNNLGLNLPEYSSRLPKISAEAIVPLAVVGSLLIAGPFSMITIALGFLAWNAAKFGLVKGGWLLSSIEEKAEKIATASHKRLVQQAINKSLSDYRNGVVAQLRELTCKVMEHRLAKLDSVSQIRRQLEELASDESIARTRQWIQRAGQLIEQCKV